MFDALDITGVSGSKGDSSGGPGIDGALDLGGVGIIGIEGALDLKDSPDVDGDLDLEGVPGIDGALDLDDSLDDVLDLDGTPRYFGVVGLLGLPTEYIELSGRVVPFVQSTLPNVSFFPSIPNPETSS